MAIPNIATFDHGTYKLHHETVDSLVLGSLSTFQWDLPNKKNVTGGIISKHPDVFLVVPQKEEAPKSIQIPQEILDLIGKLN